MALSYTNAFITGIVVNSQIRAQARKVFHEELNKRDKEGKVDNNYRNFVNDKGLYR